MTPQERAAREAAAPVLAEESAAKREAEREVQVIVAQHEATRRDSKQDAERKARRAGLAMAAVLAALYLRHRKAARDAGIVQAERELRRVGFQELTLAALLSSVAMRPLQRTDVYLRDALEAYSQDIARVTAIKAETRVAGSLTRAADALDYRLARIAHAETWSASQAEVGRIQRAAGALDRTLVREWSAVLDRRTCPECLALDGAKVKASERFSREMPLHPFCRCLSLLQRA